MKKAKQSPGNAEVPHTFEELVREFPPRAIGDGVAYDNTLAVMDRLLRVRRLNSQQAEYLETLSQLVEAYEADESPVPDDAAPIDAMMALMEEHGMTATGLGELLGDRALGGKILRRERELSKAHIRRLAEHFGVSPVVFF